jgi:FkbM family methyltransferase
MMNRLFQWTKSKAVALANDKGHGSQILFHLFYGVHNRLLRWNPGAVTMSVRGLRMRMPPEHLLPLYVGANPLQESALADISEKLAALDGHLDAIDVGANIGDTLLLMADGVPAATFLCVEGSEKFLPYLRHNAGMCSEKTTVFIEPILLGEKNTVASLQLDTQYGTGFLAPSDKTTTTLVALDSVIDNDPRYKDVTWNFLKLDTDGYDYLILRGAHALLDRTGPALFFEYVPHLFESQGVDPMEIFHWLGQRDYVHFVVYTNYGEKILSVDLGSLDTIRQLAEYSTKYRRIHFDVLAVKSKHRALCD